MNKAFSEFINDKNNIKRFLYMSVALFIAAIAFNIFISPINLVSGGSTGLSILFRELFGIDPSISIFLISFICFAASYMFLESNDCLAALYAAIVYPLCVKITEGFTQIFLIDSSHVLTLVVFAGIIQGFSQGLIYKQGLNTGGINVFSKILCKYKSVSISKANLIINMIIVLLGAYVFGFNNILYACLYLIISRYVSEKIMLGVSNNKTFCIISLKYKKIIEFLKDDLKHDATIYNVKGKYEDEKRKMIMSVIPTSEYYVLKEAIKDIDKDAFIFVCDSYEVNRQDVKLRNEIS